MLFLAMATNPTKYLASLLALLCLLASMGAVDVLAAMETSQREETAALTQECVIGEGSSQGIYQHRQRSPYLEMVVRRLNTLKYAADVNTFDIQKFIKEYSLQTLARLPLQGPKILLTFSDLENTGDYVFVKKTYEILEKELPQVDIFIIVETDAVAAKLLRIFGRTNIAVYALTSKNVNAIKAIAAQYFIRVDAPTALLSGMDGGIAAKNFLAKHKINLDRDVVEIFEYDMIEFPETHARNDAIDRQVAGAEYGYETNSEKEITSDDAMGEDEAASEFDDDTNEDSDEHVKYQAGLQAGSYGVFKDQDIKGFTEIVARSAQPATIRMQKLAEIRHRGFRSLVASSAASGRYLDRHKAFFAHVREPESLAYFVNLIATMEAPEDTSGIDIFVTYESSFSKLRDFESTLALDEDEFKQNGFAAVKFVDLKEDSVNITPLDGYQHRQGHKVLRIVHLIMAHDDVKKLIMASEPIQAATGDQSISEITSRIDTIPLYEAQDHKFTFVDALLERIHEVNAELSSIWNNGFIMYENLSLVNAPLRGSPKTHESSRLTARLLKENRNLRKLAYKLHTLVHNGLSFNESYVGIIKKELLLKHLKMQMKTSSACARLYTLCKRLERMEITSLKLSNSAHFDRLIELLSELDKNFTLKSPQAYEAVYNNKILDLTFQKALHSTAL